MKPHCSDRVDISYYFRQLPTAWPLRRGMTSRAASASPKAPKRLATAPATEAPRRARQKGGSAASTAAATEPCKRVASKLVKRAVLESEHTLVPENPKAKRKVHVKAGEVLACFPCTASSQDSVAHLHCRFVYIVYLCMYFIVYMYINMYLKVF